MLLVAINKKAYGNNVVLEHINFSVSSNGVYGIIGKNGEGKTTLFKCIAAQTKYRGEILYNGMLVSKNEIAWCPTQPFLYEYLTAEEFKKYFAALLKIKASASANVFYIPNGKLIKEMSTGMRKKVYLNALLQKRYSIYLFDEVFNGLDIESVLILERFIREIGKTKIVFISSHILSSLFNLCREIFLVQNTSVDKYGRGEFNAIKRAMFQ